MRSCLFVMFFFICLLHACSQPMMTTPKEALATEHFIETYFLQDNRLPTNLTTLTNDYLSESLGLWMLYLVEKEDYDAFREQVRELETHFLTKQNLVSWQLTNRDASTVNALIDDLRIIEALQQGATLWQDDHFKRLADKIARALMKNQRREDVFVDFYDYAYREKDERLTLSYIMPRTLAAIGDEATIAILRDAPLENGFYPLAYDVTSQRYMFQQELNLIDQFYIGYHRAQAGFDVSSLIRYSRDALAKYGKLYGRIDALTTKPTVTYESPAVYALAILMSIEADDKALARQLYEQMIALRVNDSTSLYFGGYIQLPSKETHIFDNLLPLLAERRCLDEAII